jgi:hypothetical protein
MAGTKNFPIRFLIPNSVQDALTESSYAENLRVSPLDKDLSNEATFIQIHLSGQYF